jgi:hypothetical protein
MNSQIILTGGPLDGRGYSHEDWTLACALSRGYAPHPTPQTCPHLYYRDTGRHTVITEIQVWEWTGGTWTPGYPGTRTPEE